MRIALDAMGGDDAPQINITGAQDALRANPDLFVTLVGDEAVLSPHVNSSDFEGRLSIRAAEGFVGMEEKPTDALRKKPNSSIAVCWRMMASKEVDAVVSAGNTGAVVAAGLRTRLFLKGVKRPGIAVPLPTAKGKAVLMDVGANPAAKPEHLYQYGVMGEIYAREMLAIESPRIGLMNIGSEDGKGNDLYRETHAYLLASGLKNRYVGNVEGRGLYQGEADVLICEGFVGNVVLKVSEGMAEVLMNVIGQEVLASLNTERNAAAEALRNLGRRYQYRESGGAPLLGIDGICIICHGSSDERAIANALGVATTFKDRDINAQISAQLSNGQPS
ncbi:MAG: phosphate acyltransferase PlsX [Planctomycetota bacterium]|nr:phosphate acyltransferase PlsX [Planctomycetota bacterium]